MAKMSDKKSAFDKFIANKAGIYISILALILSGISYTYTIEKRVSLLEMHDIFHDKELLQIKTDQKEHINRVENKVDNLDSKLDSVTLLVAKIDSNLTDKEHKNGRRKTEDHQEE